MVPCNCIPYTGTNERVYVALSRLPPTPHFPPFKPVHYTRSQCLHSIPTNLLFYENPNGFVGNITFVVA